MTMNNTNTTKTRVPQLQPNTEYTFRATSWYDKGRGLNKVGEPSSQGVLLPEGTRVLCLGKSETTGGYKVQVLSHPEARKADGTVITKANEYVGIEGYADGNKLLGSEAAQKYLTSRAAQKQPTPANGSNTVAPLAKLQALAEEKRRLLERLGQIDGEIVAAKAAALKAKEEFDALFASAGIENAETENEETPAEESDPFELEGAENANA